MNIFKPIFCDSISIVFFQSPTLFAAPKLSGKLGGNSGPRPSVKLGSWNIKHLSLAKINGTNRYGSKHTLPLLAKHLAAFDVCAIQEVNFHSFCSKHLLDEHHGGMRIVHPSPSAPPGPSFPPTFVRLNYAQLTSIYHCRLLFSLLLLRQRSKAIVMVTLYCASSVLR